MIGFKMSFKKYTQIYDSISEIFRNFYYNIWRIKLSIYLPLFSSFFTVIYALYTVKNLLYLS